MQHPKLVELGCRAKCCSLQWRSAASCFQHQSHPSIQSHLACLLCNGTDLGSSRLAVIRSCAAACSTRNNLLLLSEHSDAWQCRAATHAYTPHLKPHACGACMSSNSPPSPCLTCIQPLACYVTRDKAEHAFHAALCTTCLCRSCTGGFGFIQGLGPAYSRTGENWNGVTHNMQKRNNS